MEGTHCHSGDYRYCFHSILNLESSGIGRLGDNSRLFITEINESGVPNGNIIHITEEDFKKFPKLASVFRDKTQRID